MSTVASATDHPSTRTASARDRLLAAADELFYAEGVHSVGIDRVIERAGVAKASLYNAFGSKDELVKAYLIKRRQARQERITRGIERYDTPREKLLAVFDVVGEAIAEPTYRGCAFMNASAESRRGGSVEEVCDATRAWVRGLFRDLAAAAGASDPDDVAAQCVVLYDGAAVGAQMDRSRSSALVARAMAETLLDAAIRH